MIVRLLSALSLVAAAVFAVPACSSSTSDAAPGADGGAGGAVNVGGGDAGATGACTLNSDCPSSHVCLPTGECAAPSCADGAQNGNETDIDCGGSCAACDTLKKCGVGADCQSDVCKDVGAGLQCQPSSTSDGVKNGTETGVDCGGAGNPVCPDGQGCGGPADCTSDVCMNGLCAAVMCNDGIKNGTETDVDCGGPACPRCADHEDCSADTDCVDSDCSGTPLTCQPALYTDDIRNGAETDVDCGGTGDPTKNGCAPGKSCKTNTDCTSDGCDYTKHCAIHRSCTGTSSGGRYGADTCGKGGDGSIGTAQWESCCQTVDISVKEGAMTAAQTMHLDKYKVTAGRMRTFLESVSGNVRTFVQTARTAKQVPVLPVPSSSNTAGQTVLDPAWDQYLPTSMYGDQNETPDCDQSGWDGTKNACKAGTTYAPIYTAAAYHVGPTVFKANSQVEQGCEYGLPGTHTYYLGNPDYEEQVPDFTQSDYDVKPVQCVDYLVAQAFCIWDGGRLETTEEWLASWGAGTLPWSADTTDKDTRGTAFGKLTPQPGTSSTYTGCRFPSIDDSTVSSACPVKPSATTSFELVDYKYSYEYPALLNLDFAVFIAAPGRTLGRAPLDLNKKEGAADQIGDLFEVTSDITGTARNTSPFPSATNTNAPVVAWSGNGSWEVHSYVKQANGAYRILDKYGKMGLRCIHPT